MPIDVNDLPKDLGNKIKKENGVSTKTQKMTKNQVRTSAIKVIGQISELDKYQAKRVLFYLQHAIKMMNV